MYDGPPERLFAERAEQPDDLAAIVAVEHHQRGGRRREPAPGLEPW